MSEELEELKAQRPSYRDKIAQTESGEPVYFSDQYESFTESMFEYLEALEQRLTNGGI